MSIPWVIFNHSRPVFSANESLGVFSPWAESVFTADRVEMYFNSYPAIREPYIAAVEYLAAREPAAVGIYSAKDDYDYPISALFMEFKGYIPRLEHIGVTNASAGLREGDYAPEWVFSTQGPADFLEGQRYQVAQEFGQFTVLVRADSTGQ